MVIDIAALTVITSAIIAVAAIVVPLIAPVVAERAQWRRDQAAATRANISKTSQDLLAAFAYVWSGAYSHVEADSKEERKSGTDVRREVMTAYYQWRAAVWAHCDNEYRAHVLEVGDIVDTQLRTNWVGEQGKAFQEKHSNRILNLTHRVLQQLS